MPTAARIASLPLRAGEVIFAAVVAGIVGHYLGHFEAAHSWPEKRFIYTEVVAGMSILLALIWLIPFNAGFVHHAVDIFMVAAWVIAFGLLVNFIAPLKCGSIWNWGDIMKKGTCPQWKAAVAFSFLSACFWLLSALVGVWFVHRARRAGGGSKV